MAALLALGIGVGAIGCLGLDVAGTFRWPGSRPDQPPQPARMTVAWKDDMQKRSGKNMLRGFQGRVQFFAADPKPTGKDADKKPLPPTKAIPADGTLTVYGFEETPDGKEGKGPSKKYVFTGKDLKRVHREGPQGHEYNIWMAWDHAGGPERHIRLLARFDPTGGGQVVMSDNSREVLPGIAVQFAGPSPAIRKAPSDSAGRPVSDSDFAPPADANAKPADSAATANRLDDTR
jgi:hypothetical protein